MGAESSKEVTLQQTERENYMIGQAWYDELNAIEALDPISVTVIILSLVSYVLKFIPILSWFGWLIDFVNSNLNIINEASRPAIYKWILDPIHYPTRDAYLKKFGEFA